MKKANLLHFYGPGKHARGSVVSTDEKNKRCTVICDCRTHSVPMGNVQIDRNCVELADAENAGATEQGTHFNRTAFRVPFRGPFDRQMIARELCAQLAERYEGSLYRPLSIDSQSVREVSPGVCEFVYISSNGD